MLFEPIVSVDVCARTCTPVPTPTSPRMHAQAVLCFCNCMFLLLESASMLVFLYPLFPMVSEVKMYSLDEHGLEF